MYKILKNTTTGQVITITKITREEEKVVYNLYDNGILAVQGIPVINDSLETDKTLVPEAPLNFNDLCEYMGEQAVRGVYSGFEETEEVKNWVFINGSTGSPTTLRIYLPHALLGKIFGTGDPLDLLIQAMTPLADWVTRGEMGNVQYLEEILPEHLALLQSYQNQGLIIDYL